MIDALPELFHDYGFLVHVGALFYVIGFLTRNQLTLRLLLLVGTLFYGLFYFLAGPLWEPLIWGGFLAGANLLIISRMLIERTTFHMTPDQKRLYAAFSTMSPGEFRRILKRCDLRRLDAPQVVTREGEPNAQLYYVLDGEARVTKGGKSFTLGPGCFVGELSYLRKSAATATVEIPEGSRIAVWNHADLAEIERVSPAIRIAMRELLNVDLAAKVSTGRRD